MWILSSFWSIRGVWEDRVLLPEAAYKLGRLPKRAQATNSDGTHNLYFPADFGHVSRHALILRIAPADLDSVADPSLPPELSSTCLRSLVLARGITDLDGDASRIPPLLHGDHAAPPDAPELEMTTIVPKNPAISGHVRISPSGDECLRTDDGFVPNPHEYTAEWEMLDPRVPHTRQLKHRDAILLPGGVVLVLRWEPFVLGLPPNLPRTDAFEIQKGQAASLGIRMKTWDKDAPLLSKANVSALMVRSSEISNPRKPLYTQPLLLSLPLVEQAYLSRSISHLLTFREHPNKQWRGLPPLAHDLPWATDKIQIAPGAENQEQNEVYDDRPLVSILAENVRSRSLFEVHSTYYGEPLPVEDIKKALESFWKVLCIGGTFATLQGLTMVWICASLERAEDVAASDTATKLRSLGARLLLRTVRQEDREEVASFLVRLQLEYRSLPNYDAARQQMKRNPIVPPAASYLPPGGTAIYLDQFLSKRARDAYIQGANAAQIKVINQTNFESPDILVHCAGLRLHMHEGANWDLKLSAPSKPASVEEPAVWTGMEEPGPQPATAAAAAAAAAPVTAAFEPRPTSDVEPMQALAREMTQAAAPRRRRRYHDASAPDPPTPRAAPSSRRERLARAREANQAPVPASSSNQGASAAIQTEEMPKSARFAALLQQEREAHPSEAESLVGPPRREESIERLPLLWEPAQATLSVEPPMARRCSRSAERQRTPEVRDAHSENRQDRHPDERRSRALVERSCPTPAAPPAFTDAEFESRFRAARGAVMEQERSLGQTIESLNRSNRRANSRVPRTREQDDIDEFHVDMEAWNRLGEEALAFPPDNYMETVRFELPPQPVVRAQSHEGDVKPFRKQFVASYTPEGRLITEEVNDRAPELPVPRAVSVALPRVEALTEGRSRDPRAPLDPAALAQRGDLLDEGTDEEEVTETFRNRPLLRPSASRGRPGRGGSARGGAAAGQSARRTRTLAVLDDQSDYEETESTAPRRVRAPARPGRAAGSSAHGRGQGRGRGRSSRVAPHQTKLNWSSGLSPLRTGNDESEEDGLAPSVGHVPKRPRRV